MAADLFAQTYGNVFRSKIGSLSASSLFGVNKVIGVYFGAEWCAPCKDFLPKLTQFYEDCQSKDKVEFEVIFVSLDKTDDDFEKHYKQMPWLTLDEYNLQFQVSIPFTTYLFHIGI